jgi:hypothetical protein
VKRCFPAEPSRCLPAPTQTLLLRAAVLAAEPARAAWRLWLERGEDVRRALQGRDRLWTKRLLPLLWVAVHRHRLTADAGLRTLLKMAYAAEALRDALCRRGGRAVLRRLTQEGLAPVVIRGFAFAETVYDEPCLRHCHDIDLLVANGGARQAQETLTRLGFAADGESRGGRLRGIHPSGLQVTLHGSLFPAGVDARLETAALERCERQTIAGTPSTVLAPVDALLHACAHAWGREGFRSSMWICDLWFLLVRQRDTDWTAAAGGARRARLVKPLALTLEYLATALEAPIPAALRAREPSSPCRS